MLFSEPKIPQSEAVALVDIWQRRFQCSSASRKFLNLAIGCINRHVGTVSVLFSEPKIPQSELFRTERSTARRFSALQRAENSSMRNTVRWRLETNPFQCSSASRKFLNPDRNAVGRDEDEVSVLFSEPKIPQSTARSSGSAASKVSVLFSEPKIPQFYPLQSDAAPTTRFSALQRAENSSMPRDCVRKSRRR